VTDRAFFTVYGAVRSRYVSGNAFASTLVIVSGFSRAEVKVEVEVTAVEGWAMAMGCLAIIGLIFGAMLGGAVGVGLGLACTKIFNVSDFEGYSGMLVFFTFMPLGAMIGGLGGAVTLGLLAAQKPPPVPAA